MRSNVEQLVVLGALLALCPHGPAAAGQDVQTRPEPRGRPTLAVGQEWVFHAKQYGGQYHLSFSDARMNESKLVPGVQRTYHARARVIEISQTEGRQCAQIRFTAEPDAPVVDSTNPPQRDLIRRQEYTLTLDTETRQVVRLEGKPEIFSNDVLAAGDCRAVLPDAWFPVAWVIGPSDLENPTDGTEIVNFADFEPTPERPLPNTALRRSVAREPDGNVRITVGEVSMFPCKKTGDARDRAFTYTYEVKYSGGTVQEGVGNFISVAGQAHFAPQVLAHITQANWYAKNPWVFLADVLADDGAN